MPGWGRTASCSAESPSPAHHATSSSSAWWIARSIRSATPRTSGLSTTRATISGATLFEAVGHRLGHTRYLHRNAINRVLFHPFGQRITTEAHDTQRRVVHLGGSRFVRNRHPHLERRLRGEAMKLQCRQQTHQSVGMFAGHFGQGGVLRCRSIRQRYGMSSGPGFGR